MAKSVEIGSLMSRNNPVAGTLQGEDVYKQWLISKGGAGRSLREIEKRFFSANGGSGKTYSELKGTFLAAKGYTGGLSINDNWRRFCAGGSV